MDNQGSLKQLHDIHLPPPIGFWPLAWGWWFLLMFFLLVVWLVYRYRSLWVVYHQKRILMQELMVMEKKYFETKNAKHALEQLAFFLKKAALIFYPREMVGALYGEAWLNFLRSTSKNLDTSCCEKLFSQSLYQPDVNVDMSQAFKMAKKWLAQQRSLCMN